MEPSIFYAGLLGQLDKMAKSMIMYNEFFYRDIFPRLTEENMANNIVETYINILNNDEDIGEEGHIFMGRMELFFMKMVDKFSLEEEREYLRSEIMYDRRREKVSVYDIFLYFYRLVEKLKNNYFILFLRNLEYFKFDEIVEDKYLLDSILFIQKVVKIINGVIDIHRKKERILMEIRNPAKFIKNRKYY